jgi:hypothetical protein
VTNWVNFVQNPHFSHFFLDLSHVRERYWFCEGREGSRHVFRVWEFLLSEIADHGGLNEEIWLPEMAHLVEFVLATMGLTILVVWPQGGPMGWIRDRIIRPLLPGKTKGVLDCYICFSFWAGVVVSGIWWWIYGESWIWSGPVMVPAVFWVALEARR